MYLIDINVSAEIDEYPSLRFQNIRKKTKCHGRTHGRTDGQRENSIPHDKQTLPGGGGIITSTNYRILLTVLLLLYTRIRSMGVGVLSKLCFLPRFIVAIVVITAAAASAVAAAIRL